jgi:hypothetical protein
MSVAPIDAAKFAAASAAKPTPAAQAVAQSFQAALSNASANTETATVDTSAPKNEKTKAVTGHSYADILNGPRRHDYLNTSGNERDGQTFKILHRDGREYHIYGEGKDRIVVALKMADESETKSKPTSSTSGSFVANG